MTSLTQTDVDNIHRLKTFLKTPRTEGEIANHLGVPRMKVLDYLEIFVRNPKQYRIELSDVAGKEKKWVLV